MTARPRRALRIALTGLVLAAFGSALFGPIALAAAARSKAKPRPARRATAARAAAQKPPAPAPPRKVTVSILHTTDLHGHLLPWDYETAKPVDDYGLSRVATLVRRVREEPNVKTILVDAGDCIQGSPLADLHAVGGPLRKPEGDGLPDPQMACMNALGYDAFAIGNHEYNFGLTVLERARAEAKFPWLSANTMKTTPQGAGAYQAYVVKEIDGVRVGILGLTTPGVPTWDDPAHYAGLEFDDPLETARHFVPILRGMERCDAVVIVCHMGLEENDQGRPSPGQAPNENRVLAIARGVPGVDAIVMGHTHTLVPSRTENGVLLTQAGRWGQALGRLDLTFEQAGGAAWKLADKRASLTRVDSSVPSDPTIEAIALPYHQRAEEFLKTVLAQASVPLSGADGRFRDNALLDLVHRTQLKAGKADVSLAPMFNPRIAIAAGPITVRDAFALYPYENTLAVLEVPGRDLKAALEHAAEYYTGYDFGKTDAPLVNSAVPGYNFDIAQGVSYTLDLMQPVGQRVRNLSWRGKPLADDRKLKVAVSNYRVNGGGGYDMFKGKPVLYRSELPTRDLLIDELRGLKTVTAANDGNWRLVPAWVGDPAATRAGLELLVRRGVVPADSALSWGPSAPLTRQRYAAWLEQVGGPAVRASMFPKNAGKDPALAPGAAVTRDVLVTAARQALPAAVRPPGVVSTSPGDGLTVGQGAAAFADIFYPRLTLLETTDFHGSLLQSQRDRTTNRPIGGAAALATWVTRERAKNPQRTLLLDGGDWMQGTPISNLNFGRPVIEFFNRLGTDAAAVGNHEFDWSVDTLYVRMKEARFQPLGANWIEKATGRRAPEVAPWTIVERDGLRIGVIGLLTENTATVTLPQNVKAYKFPNGGAIARALSDSARAAGADLIVVVGHLPGSTDSTGAVRGELAEIARAVGGPEGAIAVLGGHSHNRLNGMVDGTPVMISGSHGTTLGRMDFVIDRRTRRPIPEETRRQLITTFADEPRPDSTTLAWVDSSNARLLPITSRILGRSKDDLQRNRTGESSLGDWVADAMRKASGADFAFQNPGGLRADLASGEVTMGDVYEVMPFDNQIATVNLSGAQVLDLLEHGISATSVVQLSGMSVIYDSDRPRGERILEVRLPNGKRLEPGGRYKVATNDFMAQGGDGFTMIAQGEGLALPGLLMRDLLIADVEKHGRSGLPLTAPAPGRLVNKAAKASPRATIEAVR